MHFFLVQLSVATIATIATIAAVGVFKCDDSNEINMMGGVTVFLENKSESQHKFLFLIC